MSAHALDNRDVDALLTAGLKEKDTGPLRWWWDNPTREGELTYETAHEVGAMLLAENWRALNYLHNADETPPAYRYTRYTGPLYPLRAIKLAEYCRYQCDDHPGWENSEAQAFITKLIGRLISQLPGYWDEPWGMSDTDRLTVPDTWEHANPAHLRDMVRQVTLLHRKGVGDFCVVCGHNGPIGAPTGYPCKTMRALGYPKKKS